MNSFRLSEFYDPTCHVSKGLIKYSSLKELLHPSIQESVVLRIYHDSPIYQQMMRRNLIGLKSRQSNKKIILFLTTHQYVKYYINSNVHQAFFLQK